MVKSCIVVSSYNIETLTQLVSSLHSYSTNYTIGKHTFLYTWHCSILDVFAWDSHCLCHLGCISCICNEEEDKRILKDAFSTFSQVQVLAPFWLIADGGPLLHHCMPKTCFVTISFNSMKAFCKLTVMFMLLSILSLNSIVIRWTQMNLVRMMVFILHPPVSSFIVNKCPVRLVNQALPTLGACILINHKAAFSSW